MGVEQNHGVLDSQWSDVASGRDLQMESAEVGRTDM